MKAIAAERAELMESVRAVEEEREELLARQSNSDQRPLPFWVLGLAWGTFVSSKFAKSEKRYNPSLFGSI